MKRALASGVMIAAVVLLAAAPSGAQYTDDAAPSPAGRQLEQVPAEDAKHAEKKEWQFLVAPYFWATTIQGRAQIRDVSAPVDLDYSQLFNLFLGFT